MLQAVGQKKQRDKLEFGGQGPQPMRYGSVGSPVSTGRRSKRDRAILGSERQIPIFRSVSIDDNDNALFEQNPPAGNEPGRGIGYVFAPKCSFTADPFSPADGWGRS